MVFVPMAHPACSHAIQVRAATPVVPIHAVRALRKAIHKRQGAGYHARPMTGIFITDIESAINYWRQQ